MRTWNHGAAIVVLSVLAWNSVPAGGGSKVEPPAAPAATPEQQATEQYNEGISYRDRAWQLEKKLESAPENKRAKIEKKIEGAYEAAAKRFEAAVALDARHYRALGSLGYARRQLGEFDQAMRAYDAALEIQPDYPEAIEYRAEAYLGLNRVNDAQNAYRILAERDAGLAADLLMAMRSWIDVQRQRGDGDPGQLDGLERWVEDRGEAAGGTGRHKGRTW
jgi:tetratricopeptide (TPR) repeat protein